LFLVKDNDQRTIVSMMTASYIFLDTFKQCCLLLVSQTQSCFRRLIHILQVYWIYKKTSVKKCGC